MDGLREFLARDVLFGRTAGQYLSCLIGMLGTLVGRWLVVALVETKLKRWASTTTATWDDLLIRRAHRPVSALMLIAGFYVSVLALGPVASVETGVRNAAILLTGFCLGFLLIGLVDVALEAYRPRATRAESRLQGAILPVLSKMLKIALVFVVVVLVLHNVGVRVTALITTAGVGGIAIAFGAQKVIANFFASLTIFSDQPFQLAERVRVSGITGVVEEIGLRSTKIRDDDGVLVTVPNLVIAEGIVENFSRRTSRRVMTRVGVTYDTPPDKLRLAGEIITEILRGEPALEERQLVSFVNFAESSLEIQIIYWVKGIAFEEYLAVQNRINSAIMRRFSESGIEMAFPTRTIYHKQVS